MCLLLVVLMIGQQKLQSAYPLCSKAPGVLLKNGQIWVKYKYNFCHLLQKNDYRNTFTYPNVTFITCPFMVFLTSILLIKYYIFCYCNILLHWNILRSELFYFLTCSTQFERENWPATQACALTGS